MQQKDIPALDGIRGLAIILVVIRHSAYFMRWPGPYGLQLLEGFAYSGVDLFFVLSGFLLFVPYAQSMLLRTPWPTWRGFYLRRIRRIVPAYYVFIALPLAFLLFDVQHLGRTVLAFLASVTLFYDWNTVAWYALVTNFDAPLWSLTVEMQFYVVLPWLALGTAWFAQGRVKRMVIALVLVTVYGLGVRAFATIAHGIWHWPFPLLPPIYGMRGKYLEAFAAGMLVATLYSLPMRVSNSLRWLLLSLVLLGLLGSLAWWSGEGALSASLPSAALWSIFGDWAICCCFAGLLYIVLIAPKFAHLFAAPPLRFLGRISYSMYLWHNVVLLLMLWHDPSVARLGLAWGVTLILSCASYYGVERPFLRTRARAKVVVAPS